MSHWTPSALAALTALSSRGKTQFTESSHVHYRCWIWPKCLGNYPCDWREEGGVSLLNLPRQPLLIWHTTGSTILTLIRRVAVRSDCRCRLCIRVRVCVCGEWAGGSTKLRKKKQNPKISLLLASCRNINEPTPPNIKTGSTGVHQWGHASSPPRHQTDDLSSRVRRKRPKLRPTFWFCQRGCSDPHGALYNHVMNTRV